MTGQLNQDFGLVQVRSDLWINPRAILFVEGFDDSVVINLNGTDKVISWPDWNDIRPHVVTLPAPAAGSVPAPQNVTDETQRSALSITAAVDEAIAEDEQIVSWVRVDEVEKDTFYSKTSRSHRDMWRLRTIDGRQVNVFDHSDPLRDQKHLLQEAGYLDLFRSMEDGQVAHWTQHPIEIDVVTDGAFWKVIRINKRANEAGPDETKSETQHHMFSGDFYSEIDLKEQIWDAKRAAGHYDDVLGPVDPAFQLPKIEDLVLTEEFWRNAYPDDSDETIALRMSNAKERLAEHAIKNAQQQSEDMARLAARSVDLSGDDDADEDEDE